MYYNYFYLNLDETCLNNSQSNSVQHDISAIFPHNLHLFTKDPEQINSSWSVQLPIFSSLWRLYFISIQDIQVPFLENRVSKSGTIIKRELTKVELQILQVRAPLTDWMVIYYLCCSLHSLNVWIHQGIHSTTLGTNLGKRLINPKPNKIILVFNYPTSDLVGSKKNQCTAEKRNIKKERGDSFYKKKTPRGLQV